MLSNEYIEALGIIESAKSKLDRILKNAPTKEMEDVEACGTLENLVCQLERSENIIKYFSRSAIEGNLWKETNGRFSFDGDELTCGASLEVFEDGEWYAGRVEHDGKYYFYNSDLRNPPLYEGMRVRIRNV